jgi:[NiFe] hydrogenase assembly HybE family chaperone
VNTRVATLQAVFAEIAGSRMAGLPLLNPRLQVEAIGFELLHAPAPAPTGEPPACSAALPCGGPCALGVLVTPWFMNLVCLPLLAQDLPAAVGQRQSRLIGGQQFDFLVAHEPALGSFGACSLFSPMQDFGDAAMARATALAVLDLLRQGPAAPLLPSPQLPPVAPRPAVAGLAPGPARRGFLFGRSGAGA